MWTIWNDVVTADSIATYLTQTEDDVRRLDVDRYRSVLLADHDARVGLISLLGFHGEVAKISDVVSEPMLGQIRLQWWREAVDECYAGIDSGVSPRDHQVVQLLYTSMQRLAEEDRQFTRSLFDDLLQGREVDLYDSPIGTMEELERYAQHTVSCLLLLQLEVLGVEAMSLQKAASHIGTAWGVLGVLRSAYIDLPKRRCFLPLDMMETHGVELDAFGSEAFQENVNPVFDAMMDAVQGHVDQARTLIAESSRDQVRLAAPVLSIVFYAEHYMRAIRKLDGRVLHYKLPQAGVRPIWKSYRLKKSGRLK